jgi:hypothetical protein
MVVGVGTRNVRGVTVTPREASVSVLIPEYATKKECPSTRQARLANY